jgi:hypothetical protein
VKNLVQICNVLGGRDTIEEHTKVTRLLGGTVIAVSGVWPALSWNGKDKAKNIMPPTVQLDDVKKYCDENEFHFIQCEKYMWSGAQYNMALDYIKSNKIPMDFLMWFENDVALSPFDLEKIVEGIESAKLESKNGVVWKKQYELFPDKRYCFSRMDNQGFLIGDACWRPRFAGDDHTHRFKKRLENRQIGISGVFPYHLHLFKEFTSCRINNGVWNCGGQKINISKCEKIEDEYVDYLFSKYDIKSKDVVDATTYIGLKNTLKEKGNK